LEFVPDENGVPVYIGVGCCDNSGVCHRHDGANNDAGCFAGLYNIAANVLPRPKTWHQAVDLCYNEGLELCAAPLSMGICNGVGCSYNQLYQWSTTQCEPGDANYREGCETPAPTATPTTMPATWWDSKKKRKDDATLLIAIIACVAGVCACGCLAYARCVRLAKKKPSRLHEAHGRMVSWYEAPAQAALRQQWGSFPTRPEELEGWPGFVRVTNAFMDACDGTASTEVLPAMPSAPPLPLAPIKAEAVEMLTESPPPPPEGWFASWRATPEPEPEPEV